MFLTEVHRLSWGTRLTNCDPNKHPIFPLSGEKQVRPKSFLNLLLHYTNLRRRILSIPVTAYLYNANILSTAAIIAAIALMVATIRVDFDIESILSTCLIRSSASAFLL